MRADADSLLDIPCFRCLFWDRKRQSHLYCNPGECEELTEWLLKEAQRIEEMEEPLTFVDSPSVEVTETRLDHGSNPKE